ncbi:MAG: hypothetical protein E5W15_16825 [Mesorhizobium sp.]|nr:hypothetical protein EJ068_28345 [Mesorhizobium sp. M2A.F.Ca.ET.043.02.1.1]RUW35330.1 hypothetical protein EOA37_28290 [Mesorhizobium sp. M2A.F.Ca.ET.015.02.1.1]RUW65030.1 hypothetical protein EOA28_33755 [Mesorhizobium sp. M2A.F.Ca.ET.067.02.1.1]RVC94015.1 hypothetical protein EN739_18885 [Mesorhizobium sp. M2A.F.Ca.ET.017.03.2.1]RVC95102.1 hypothetical protein EN753_32390 [Mesorhizobium sp. M2A.F.Ca.ET.029.05.1.1]RWB41017.1 MAG: hypothetical protein EOQ46_23515 [Mesorhizobium sp.]
MSAVRAWEVPFGRERGVRDGWCRLFRPRGEEYQSHREDGATPKLPISPLVGEMSGRTEGGAVE